MNNIDLKSDRLNFQPSLYKGCSLQELLFLAGVSLALNIFAFVTLFLLLFGKVILGIAFAIPAAFGTMIISAIVLGNIKQNKPMGYHQQLISIWLDNAGIWRSPFLKRTGKWSVGRVE